MSWNDNAVYFIVWSRYNCRAFFSRDYRKLPKTNQRTEGTDGSVNHTHLRGRLDWEVGLYVVGSEAKWCRLTTNRLEFNMTLNFVLGNNRDHPGGKCNFSPVRRVGDMKLVWLSRKQYVWRHYELETGVVDNITWQWFVYMLWNEVPNSGKG